MAAWLTDKKAERYEKTAPQQIAATMAILIDKYTASGVDLKMA